MAQSKQALRSRIKSVNSTRKITSAMEMIANAKLFRMRNKMESNRIYASKIHEVVTSIMMDHPDSENPLLKSSKSDRSMYIVFCSDLGLCGAYNQNVLKAVREVVKKEDDIYLIGTSLYHTFVEDGYHLLNEEAIENDAITPQKLNEITSIGIQKYLAHDIGGLVIIYTHFVNTMTFSVKKDQLLPFVLKEESKQIDEPFVETLFEPNVDEILDELIPMMISSVAYSDWMETSVSEQGSRRMAMKTATDNADELSDQLLLEYNKARQAAITQEITEIVGGSNAV